MRAAHRRGIDALFDVDSTTVLGATGSAPAAPSLGWSNESFGHGCVGARRMPGWLRLAGAMMVLPLLTWQSSRPLHGAFELIAADMGQGHAVLARTRTHALLYDTGPRYSSETDAGQRVLVPWLRSLGSTGWCDHQPSETATIAAAAPAVLAMQPQAHVRSSTPSTHFLNDLHKIQRCESGQQWEWDGVQFSVLHPDETDYLRPLKPNAMSCVLRVQSTDGVGALLGGRHRGRTRA
jgi:competence protein ComEC